MEGTAVNDLKEARPISEESSLLDREIPRLPPATQSHGEPRASSAIGFSGIFAQTLVELVKDMSSRIL